MASTDQENDLHLSEWSAYVVDLSGDLGRLVFDHEDRPSASTKALVAECLDKLESLIGATRRRLNADA